MKLLARIVVSLCTHITKLKFGQTMEAYPTHNFTNVLVMTLVITTIVFVGDLIIPLGVAGGVPYVLAILISLRSPKIKLIIYIAVLCSILTVVGYLASPVGGELWKVLFNRAIALFAIWVTTILGMRQKRTQESLERSHDELAENLKRIKTLSGLVPICATCKKIRDDKGYWNQLEVYIRDHSEANFTHGYCPECAKKMLDEVRKM